MFSFYTMLPINVEQRHMDSMNRKFWLCPVVGLFYAFVLGLVFVGVHKATKSYLLGACAAVFAVSFLNRYLHLDGTIDVGDGLTVAGSREDHIRALKDTRVGAGGVCTGIFVIILTIAGYTVIGIDMIYIALVIEIFAKNSQVVTAAFGNPSEGMASESVRNTNKIDVVKSYVLSLVLVFGTYAVLDFFLPELYGITNYYILDVSVALLISVVWGMFMAYVGNRSFGFVNGDVLGASNETFKAVCIFVIAIIFTTVTL